MKICRLASFLIILSIFNFISTPAYAAKKSGPFLSLGFGILSVSNILVANSSSTNPTEAFDGKDWKFYDFGFGYGMNSGNTQIYGNFLMSESKELNSDLGTRHLIGGGVTKVSSKINHGGLFLGLRQKLYSRLFLSGGIGAFYQEKNFTYTPAVVNGSDSGGTEGVFAWFLGTDIKITNKFLFGAKLYKSFIETPTSMFEKAFGINGPVFHLTFLF